MFKCKSCPKSYPSRSSLTRHEQNHKEEAQHVCHVCGVGFRRRDIYVRHCKGHDNAETKGSKAARDRQRCHTACVACRQARIKCDGEQPCSSCVMHNRSSCTYDAPTGRLSRAVPRPPSPPRDQHASPGSVSMQGSDVSASSEPMQIDSVSPATMPSSTASLKYDAEVMVGPMPEQPGVTQARHFSVPDFASPPDPAFEQQNEHLTNTFDDTLMDFSAMTIPDWQWIHQDLFFQSDPSLWTVPTFDPVLSNFLPNQTPSNDGSEAYINLGAAPSVWNANTVIPPIYPELLPQASGIQPGQGTVPLSTAAPEARVSQPKTEAAQRHTSVAQVVEEIVQYAQSAVERGGNHGPVWFKMSQRLSEAMSLGAPFAQKHVLHRLVDTYFERFHPLWGLFMRRKAEEYDRLQPFLFLTLASIGAMYEGKQGRSLGSLLHERLRTALLASCCELAEIEPESLWLCHTLILTQMNALYFGQRRAFSYAQHVGSVLVVEARRMNLLTAPRFTFRGNKAFDKNASVEAKKAFLTLVQERTKLAYGILRADAYVSVLLNTRPSLSPTELDIEASLNSYDIEKLSVHEMDEHIRSIISPQHLYFSDLVRIAMERDEGLPSLEPAEHELLMFGLQKSVWQYCHDADSLTRLGESSAILRVHTARSGPDLLLPPVDSQSLRSIGLHPPFEGPRTKLLLPRTEDDFESPSYGMKDMRADNDRLLIALRKWKQSFFRGHTGHRSEHGRAHLLTGLLMYHLSFLRMHAPVKSLHRLSYGLDDKRGPEKEVCDSVNRWAQTEAARTALEHAVAIWQLINKELVRPANTRARFNIFSFIGLHHAGVVVWVYASARLRDSSDSDPPRLVQLGGQPGVNDIPVCRENVSVLLTAFARIYGQLCPEWSLNSSFAATALRMSQKDFRVYSTSNGSV